MRYPMLIDGEAGAYGVVFPDLPGCVAMGPTIEEAICNAEEAMQDWVDSMEARGHAVPVPSDMESIAVPAGNVLSFIAAPPPGRPASRPGI